MTLGQDVVMIVWSQGDWRRVQTACVCTALAAAMIIPLIVWLIWGLGESADVAQVVSVPLAVGSIAIGLIPLPRRGGTPTGEQSPIPSVDAPPSRQRSRRREASPILLGVAVAIGATGLAIGVWLARSEGGSTQPESPAGQQLSEPQIPQSNNEPGSPQGDHWSQFEPPANEPPANQPPANQPPANKPPANQPPANEPPTSQPPNPPPVQQERVVELSTQPGMESVDIDWWRQVHDKSGDLQMDQNGIYAVLGAKLSVIEDSPEPTYARCARVQDWANGRVDFVALHEGSQLCAQSRMGRYAMLQVRALPSPSGSNGRFIFFGRTWELAP